MTAPEDESDGNKQAATTYKVGYCRPPLHTRFAPGVSGNPAGRRKGVKNFKTLFEDVLREEISLREGNVTKKITKGEAIVRSLVVNALKGDPRSQQNLFRLAEQTGQFAEDNPSVLQVMWLDNSASST